MPPPSLIAVATTIASTTISLPAPASASRCPAIRAIRAPVVTTWRSPGRAWRRSARQRLGPGRARPARPTGCGRARCAGERYAWPPEPVRAGDDPVEDEQALKPPRCRGLRRPQFVDRLDQTCGQLAVLAVELAEVLVEQVSLELVLHRTRHESAQASITDVGLHSRRQVLVGRSRTTSDARWPVAAITDAAEMRCARQLTRSSSTSRHPADAGPSRSRARARHAGAVVTPWCAQTWPLSGRVPAGHRAGRCRDREPHRNQVRIEANQLAQLAVRDPRRCTNERTRSSLTSASGTLSHFAGGSGGIAGSLLVIATSSV